MTLLPGLPERAGARATVADAEALLLLVKAKGPGPQVAAASADLRWALIGAYALVVAPKQVPDLAHGAQLYRDNCASCHGAEGKGDGAAGKGLDPAPADFTDAARIAQRSAYGLYNTITLGVGGTGMAAYRQLTDDDRWALAFFVSQFAVTPQQLAGGEAAWKSGLHAETFANLENVATLSSGRGHRALRPGRRAGAAVAARASRGARRGRCVADRVHGEDAAREPRARIAAATARPRSSSR